MLQVSRQVISSPKKSVDNEANENEEKTNEIVNKIAPDSELVKKVDSLEMDKKDLSKQSEVLLLRLNQAKTVIKNNEYVETEVSFKPQTLNKMQISSVVKYIRNNVFSEVKVVNNELLQKKPAIVEDLFKHLQMPKLAEQVLYKDHVIHWLKHTLTQKRRYIKNRLKEAVQSKFV